jgi:hypothetical protein
MEYELKHWGVKGMKWGVRRYQNKDGSLTPAGKKQRKSDDYHEDYKRAHDKKPLSQMSDKELQARNNRLQQEQNYQRLTQKTSVGEKAVKAFIATAGTIVAIEGAYKTYKRIGNGALDKIGDWVVNSIDMTKPFA